MTKFIIQFCHLLHANISQILTVFEKNMSFFSPLLSTVFLNTIFIEMSSRWCNLFQPVVIHHSRRRQSSVVTSSKVASKRWRGQTQQRGSRLENTTKKTATPCMCAWMSFVYAFSQTVQTTTVLLSHMIPKSHLLFARSVSIELTRPLHLPSERTTFFFCLF